MYVKHHILLTCWFHFLLHYESSLLYFSIFSPFFHPSPSPSLSLSLSFSLFHLSHLLLTFLPLIPLSPLSQILLKIVSDVIELHQNAREGVGETCCFDDHDILIESSVFDEVDGGPVAAARAIFVRATLILPTTQFLQPFSLHINLQAWHFNSTDCYD